MKRYHLASKEKAKPLRKWRLYTGIAVVAIMLGISAIPLPAYIKNRRIENQIRKVEDLHRQVPVLESKVEALRKKIPRQIEWLNQVFHEWFPEVDSLLTLRNLLLAQANAAKVTIDRLDSSEPALVDLDDSSISNFRKLNLQVLGSADVERLMMLLGFMESTGMMYRINSLDANFSKDERDSVSFRLDVNIFFRTSGLLKLKAKPETKGYQSP